MSTHKASSDLQQFAVSVAHTLTALQRLEQALKDEQTALGGTAPATLEQTVQAKLAVLSELEPVVAQRDAIQQRLGMPPGLPGGDQLLASAPPDATVCVHWRELKTVAARVEKLNTQNGQLARQGEKSARYAVSILTGRPSEPEVYGRQGSAAGSRLSGLTLGKV